MPIPLVEADRLFLVCLGSFNPAIFHPQWFVRMNLIAEADGRDDAAEIKVISPDVADIVVAGMTVQCLPDRLTFGTSNPGRFEQLQELIIKTLETLPHTPVTACGINRELYYRVPSEEYWHAIGHALVPKDPIWKPLLPDPRTIGVSIKQAREGRFEGEVNITVQSATRFHPGIGIKTNWHYSLPSEARAANSAENVAEYLKAEWTEACSMPSRVAEAIFTHIKQNA